MRRDRDKLQQADWGARTCAVCSGEGCDVAEPRGARRRQIGQGCLCHARELRLQPKAEGTLCRVRSRGAMWSAVGSRKSTVGRERKGSADSSCCWGSKCPDPRQWQGGGRKLSDVEQQYSQYNNWRETRYRRLIFLSLEHHLEWGTQEGSRVRSPLRYLSGIHFFKSCLH